MATDLLAASDSAPHPPLALTIPTAENLAKKEKDLKPAEGKPPVDLLAQPTFQPVKDFTDYTKQNFKAGVDLLEAPAFKKDSSPGPEALQRIGDIGSRALGAVEAITAPVGAAAHAAISKPLERATKLPAEYTDLLLAFTPVGVGGALGAATKAVDKLAPSLRAEKIDSAAIKAKNGEIYTGDNHDDIKKGLPAGKNLGKKAEEGFTTTKGRFVNRNEAGYIAKFGKQTKGDVSPGGLHAGDLKEESVATRAVKAVQSVLAPTAMSRQAGKTEGIIREQRGWAERKTETAKMEVEAFAKQVNQLPPEEQRNFIAYIEGRSKGAKLNNKDLQKAADGLREVFQKVRSQLEALPDTEKMGFVEDYFPHMWKNPDKARAAMSEFVSKMGSGKFTKERSIPTIEDGLARGLEPAEGNALDHAMQYVGNMQNYIALKKTQRAMSDAGLRKFFPIGKQPAGWVELQGTGNRTAHGTAYAPEDAARVYNRNYSAGWTGRTGDLYRGLQAATNGALQLKLSLSGYHAWLVVNEAATAAFTKGLGRLAKGDKAGALRAGAETFPGVAGVKGAVLGERVMNQALGKEMGLDKDVIDYLTNGGARFRGIDKTMRMSASGNYWESWKRGTLAKDFKEPGFFKKMSRFMDSTMYPLFVKGIPNVKNAVNYEGLRDWMKAHPGASHDEINQAARDIIDHTDNQLGEMIQDNLFWDKKFKQSLQVILLSVGWNLGTLRGVGGGSLDLAKSLSEGTELSPRAKYIIGLPLIHMLNASVYQRLKTGSWPDQPQDLINPKTGGISPYGNSPERAAGPPDNLKDVINWQKHTLQEAANKFNPVWPMLVQMATGKDWRGDPIAYEYMNQAPGFVKGWAGWLLKNAAPISIEGAADTPLKGSAVGRGGRMLGERPANMEVENPPAYRDWQKAKKLKAEKQGLKHIQADESRRAQ